MRRGGLARLRPTSSLQDIRETVGSPFPQPHFDYRSNDRADHVLEKPVGISLNENLVVMADDGESLQIADGIVVVGEASLEGRKVLRSDQCRRRILHGHFVKWFIDVPDERTIDGGTGWAIENPIGVELASCIMLSMKVVVHEDGGTDGNVFGQYGIERSGPIRGGPIAIRAETRHLSTRMHTGIRSACADDRYRGVANLVDGPLDRCLDRGVIGLALPACITGPGIFQD